MAKMEVSSQVGVVVVGGVPTESLNEDRGEERGKVALRDKSGSAFLLVLDLELERK